MQPEDLGKIGRIRQRVPTEIILSLSKSRKKLKILQKQKKANLKKPTHIRLKVFIKIFLIFQKQSLRGLLQIECS